MRTQLLFSACIVFLLCSCKKSLQSSEIIGTWNYLKIEELNRSADSLTMADVKVQHPTIVLYKSGELEMNWGGKLLSHGRYKLDGMNIQYTETLEDGNTRTFPFYVSEISPTRMVFETKGRDGSRVTAGKVK